MLILGVYKKLTSINKLPELPEQLFDYFFSVFIYYDSTTQ